MRKDFQKNSNSDDEGETYICALGGCREESPERCWGCDEGCLMKAYILSQDEYFDCGGDPNCNNPRCIRGCGKTEVRKGGEGVV